MKKRGFFFTVDVTIAMVIIVIGFLLIWSFYVTEGKKEQSYFYAQDAIDFLSYSTVGSVSGTIPYIYKLIQDKKITTFENTLLEQITLFYIEDQDRNSCAAATPISCADGQLPLCKDGQPPSCADGQSPSCTDWLPPSCAGGLPPLCGDKLCKTNLTSKMLESIFTQIIPEQYGTRFILDNKDLYMKNSTTGKGEETSDILVSSKKVVVVVSNKVDLSDPYVAEVRAWR